METVLLGRDPLGQRQKYDEDLIRCDSGQVLNQGFRIPPLRESFLNASCESIRLLTEGLLVRI